MLSILFYDVFKSCFYWIFYLHKLSYFIISIIITCYPYCFMMFLNHVLLNFIFIMYHMLYHVHVKRNDKCFRCFTALYKNKLLLIIIDILEAEIWPFMCFDIMMSLHDVMTCDVTFDITTLEYSSSWRKWAVTRLCDYNTNRVMMSWTFDVKWCHYVTSWHLTSHLTSHHFWHHNIKGQVNPTKVKIDIRCIIVRYTRFQVLPCSNPLS
jgi:hypothetical protein